LRAASRAGVKPPANRSIAESRETFSELQKDLGRDGRVAALADELDRSMKVGLAVRQPLCQVNWIARLDQHVQAPARDALALGLGVFSDLWHGRRWLIRPFKDEPCLRKLEIRFLASGRDRLVRAPAELLEPAVERRPLRLCFVREPAHSLA
jgi:hypothetical protein